MQSEITTPEPAETVFFRVPAWFKLALDLEIARRRSTLRAEITAAIAERFGLPNPDEKTDQGEAA